ncbi:MAG: hypothetical protein Q4D06_00620 [Coriobacteriia bacterium]|nr:hypothetical protein [Coriobacteriia bacterium]
MGENAFDNCSNLTKVYLANCNGREGYLANGGTIASGNDKLESATWYFDRSSTTPANGHNWGEWVFANDATCTEDAHDVRTCARCAGTESRTVENTATGHEWGDASYAWSDDYHACTASRSCANNAAHVQTCPGTVTSQVITEPTYDDLGQFTSTATFDEPWASTVTATADIPALARTLIAVPKARTGLTYTGKAQAGVAAGKGYTVAGGTRTSAGSYTATLTLAEGYAWADGTLGPKSVKWTISKKSQALGVSAAQRSKKVAYSKRSARYTSKVSVTGAKGKLTWSKVSGTKKLTVGKTTGKVRVTAGTKRGTYRIKVKVSSATTTNYKAASKTVTVTVRVK